MIIFTPNTVIKSADINLNFAEVFNKRAILTICFNTSQVSMSFPVAWTFYKVPLNYVQFEYDPADLLSLSNNGIKIGAGVSYIKAHGIYGIYNNGGEADFQNQIYKNSTGFGTANYNNAPSTSDYITTPVAQATIPVVENDIIYLYANLGATGSRNLFGFTSLTVEVVA